MMGIYWPVTVGLIWQTVRRRSIVWFALLAIVVLLASIEWRIVAIGMIGI